jgi:hypothetical protein
MPGEARSSDFLLSTATLMIGPPAKVMELTPALHSVGLVKNVQVTSDPQFTELTQGTEAVVVASVVTSAPAKISAELYEYSARNLAYGAGLDGADVSFNPITSKFTLAAAVTAGGATVELTTGQAATLGVGEYFVIQDTNTPDVVHVGKVGSKASDVITLATGFTMPTSTVFAVATTVIYKVANLKIGANFHRPIYGAKLIGIMPESGEPVTLIFPKIKITKGLSMAFQNENFSNMPFEFTPYASLPADPYYTELGGSKTFMVLKR